MERRAESLRAADHLRDDLQLESTVEAGRVPTVRKVALWESRPGPWP